MALDYKNSLGRYRRYLATLQNQPLWNASFWLSMTIVLIILMVVLFLRPTLITIASLYGQSKEQQILLTRMDDKLEKLKLAEQNYTKAVPKFESLEQMFPKQSNWGELTDRLTEIASESGTQIKEIRVEEVILQGEQIEQSGNSRNSAKKTKEETLPSGTHKVKFYLSVYGGYGQFLSILENIEKDQRLIIVENARINKQKDGLLDLTINGYAAFFIAPIKK